MKVFFAVSPKAKVHHAQMYKSIYSKIEELGYQHISDQAVTEDHESFYKDMSTDDHKKKAEFYNTIIRSIQKSDITIFDASVPGTGIGMAIDRSLDLNKPTIVIYHQNTNPIFLFGLDDDKFLLKPVNEKNCKKVISDALEIARERRDKRFNFFISPKLLDYLEKSSKEEGITKSKFIRNLIVDYMRKTQSLEGSGATI